MRPLALASQARLPTGRSLQAVVPGIEREIVRRAVEPDPVGRVDPAAVGGGRAVRWDQDAQPVDPFTDIRELQARLKAAGATIEQEVDEASTGPANFVISDPDGNPILVDQHR